MFHQNTFEEEELVKKATAYQKLLLKVLRKIKKNGYRRYRDDCYEERMFNSHKTLAWKCKCSIADMVYQTADKDFGNFEEWLLLTSKSSTARDVIRHLTECKDAQFPDIKKDRHVWSFQNGFLDGYAWNEETQRIECRFYPYGTSWEGSRLNATTVSAKYFDLPLDPHDHLDDWFDIPTPWFQSMLDYQRFEPEVARWMYVAGGKLCYDVNEIDGWQVIPFLKGIARSGKSTIITKVFKKFYDAEDVKTLSNNMERKFGLSSICEGLMYIAPEVKGDLCLEQAEFQSIVSGEDVAVAQKFAKAKMIEWKVPGVLGGNQIPNWSDNSGSVLRRLLTWNFGRTIEQADPHLDAKLHQEMPLILLKCVRAYLDYAQRYADQDIWNVVPEYFKNIQSQVAMVTSALMNFLNSGKLRFSADLFIPQKIFLAHFTTHCIENNLGRHKFNPDFYAGAFSNKGLDARIDNVTYACVMFGQQTIIFGCDLVENGGCSNSLSRDII